MQDSKGEGVWRGGADILYHLGIGMKLGLVLQLYVDMKCPTTAVANFFVLLGGNNSAWVRGWLASAKIHVPLLPPGTWPWRKQRTHH